MNNLIAQKTITVANREKEVQIYKLNASEGIVLGTKLLKLALPVLGGFADEIFAEETRESPKTFSEMSQRIISQLEPDDLLVISKKLFVGLSVDKKSIEFDEYFMGNYGELLLILEFALKENFQSFFEGTGLKARFMKALGAMTTEDQAESDEQ